MEAVPELLWRPGDAVEPLRRLLAEGGVLVVPTESSYGVAADPRSAVGVQEVYRLKGRPDGKALPVVAASIEQLRHLGIVVDSALLAALEARWPAPLTAVLPLAAGTSMPAAAGGSTLAVRIPAHPALRSLLSAVGPLTATSANPAGSAPYTEVTAVIDWLLAAGKTPATARVVTGAPCGGGPPSTLVRWSGDQWQILRPGPVPPPELPESPRS